MLLTLRPILLAVGVLLTMLALAMQIPAVVDAIYDNPDWKSFTMSSFITGLIGVSLIITNYTKERTDLSIKQAFLLTACVWLVLVSFSALPFMFSEIRPSYTDAFFEAMSALTTTGATVFVGLDDMPPGILLWRSILQWLGGIGIIVMAMAVLPMLRIGGMQLFRSESSDKSDKVLPRVTQICGAIFGIYLFCTIVCATLMWMVGLEPFDAICHAMTTIATAGFSTKDASIGHFDSINLEVIMMFFMVISGIPFVLYIQLLRGQYIPLWRDSQVRWFLGLLVISVTAVTLWLIFISEMEVVRALRVASFNVISATTTTGFSTTDYGMWGSFPVVFIFLLSVVGGCTGSTTGGIKIFRYQVLFEIAKAQINQLVQPHGVFRPQYNKKAVTEAETSSVLSFFILFALCFSVLAMLLSTTGLDFITSMSAAASMMSNLGPGLGDVIGPVGNYSSLSDVAKWLCTIGMIVGRLEIFTILILFSPYFWRN